MFIGESLVGESPNAAHINLYIGPRTGPVGTALATAAAAPRQGYIPFMVVMKPNVPVKPGQRRPISKLRIVPVTTPAAKSAAITRVQRRASVR